MVTALRLATGEVWKDQDGKQQERTEWHRVVFYRRLAEVAAEFLKKGSKLNIFKKPVHVVPMWSAALGRSVETVWPSIMEIQTTASRTGLWVGMDRPVWGPDVTQSFTGRFSRSYAGALVVIHNCHKARHSGMDCRNPDYMDVVKVAIHGAGYPLPGGYDESLAYLCISMSAGAWEPHK